MGVTGWPREVVDEVPDVPVDVELGVVLEQPARANTVAAAAAERSNLRVMIDHPRKGCDV
jgi:hypothetical protein